MDENILATAEDTQPEVESVGADPVTVQDDADNSEGSATAATPAENTDESIENTAPPAEEETFFAVKHNKQVHSLSRDDAMAYAQKGMKYDELQPVLETLKYVATSEGKTLAEFVEAIRKQNEDNLFTRLMDRCGDEEIAKELLEVEKSKHKAAYETLLQNERNEQDETEEALAKRLADEFDSLRKEFPQYSEFAKVPKAVVRESYEKGISLLDAQLRYEHRQRVKVEKEKATQLAAAKASTGSQQATGAEQLSSVEAAMMKGLWG